MLASKGFSTEDRLSAASGGNNTYTYSDGSGDYKIHKYTSDGTFTINLPIPFDILVIGGGGSGGGAGSRAAGGAGGLRWFTDQHLILGDYTCTIGAGGGSPPNSDAEGIDGANSRFLKVGTIDIEANGGGSGGGTGNAPQKHGNTGGSGGGSNYGGDAGIGNEGNFNPVEGYNGGVGSTDGGSNSWYYGGGGGGGAGGAGDNGSGTAGGAGGVGASTFVNSSATETTAFLSGASAGELVSGVRYIAGGGGGGLYLTGSATAGGHGGGGDGGYGANGSGTTAGTNGTANTGSGGGGGSNSHKGGQGGSGIIIIRYRLH